LHADHDRRGGALFGHCLRHRRLIYRGVVVIVALVATGDPKSEKAQNQGSKDRTLAQHVRNSECGLGSIFYNFH
jgi:hypothetical protein